MRGATVLVTRPWLIVDGYNVIAADPRYAELAEQEMDGARVRLVTDVSTFSEGSHRAVVVFDAGGNPRSDGAPHRIGNVTVIFSRAGEDADAVVEALVARARQRGEEVVVVTSDAATQQATVGPGVTRVSSAGFIGSLRESRAEWRGHSASGDSKSVVGDRIAGSTREALGRWARGER